MAEHVQEELQRIARFASRFRRRAAWTSALTALLATASALLVVLGLGLGAVVLWGPQPAVRLSAGLLGAGALVGLGVALVLAVLRSRRGALATARDIEARAPELRDGLLSVASALPVLSAGAAPRERFSTALFARLVERTSRRLAALDPAALVPTRGLASWGAVFGLLIVGALVSALLNGGVLAASFTRLLDGPAPVAPRIEDRTQSVPHLMGDLSVHVVPPAYTGRPERQEHNVSGDLRGLPGTRVRLRTRSLLPVREATLVLDSRPDDPVPLALLDPGLFEGELVLEAPDSYRFHATGSDGARMEESTDRFIEIVPDQAPQLRLLVPEKDLRVNRDDRVELLVEARDDFGLREIVLAYERSGRDTAPVRRKLPSEAIDERGQVRSEIVPSALGVRPGEYVDLWIEATDNDEVSGPKTGRSERRRIRVFSPDEKHEELLRAERAMFERLLLLLGDRLVRPALDELPVENGEAFLTGATSIVNATQAALNDFEQLLAAMGEDSLTTEDVLRDCAEIHSRLSERLAAEKDLVRDALLRAAQGRASTQSQHEIVRENGATVAETERAVLQLDRLIDRQHQERVLSDGRSIVDDTDTLLDMLRRLEADADDGALRLEMMRELERLQGRLDRMSQGLRRQAKALPDERFNPAALGDRGTMSSLRSFHEEIEEVRRLIQENRLAEARERLERIAAGSREMMATLEGDFDERGSARRARAARFVRRARRRVAAIASSQQELQESTAARGEAYREQVQQQTSGRIERSVEKLSARLDRLERLLRNVNREDLHSQDRARLGETMAQMRDLRPLLDEGDLGQAARLAERITQALRSLREEVGQSAMFSTERKHKRVLRKAERRLGHAQEAAQELSDSLRSLLPDPRDIMGRGEQRRVGRLAKRQRELGERLRRTRRALEPLGEEQPGLQGRLDRLLGEAQESMERAGGELEALDPDMAEEHQLSVLRKLAAAREHLDRAARPEPGGDDGVGVGEHRQAVEIPQAAEYRVPAAFREEILRAMREEMPTGYRELLEAYYESLIR